MGKKQQKPLLLSAQESGKAQRMDTITNAITTNNNNNKKKKISAKTTEPIG